MEELVVAICLGIFEMLLVLIAAVILGTLWIIGLAGYSAARFGVGGLRATRQAFRLRRYRRELGAVLVESQSARADIRRISDRTTRQLRALANEGRRSR